MGGSLLRVRAHRLSRPTTGSVSLLVWAVLLVLVPIGLVTGAPRSRFQPPGALVRLSAPAAGPAGARLALLAEVHRELATMTDTGYQHKTDVDDGEGGFYFDCSGFVDYALAHSLPADLNALPITTPVRPLAKDFEHHFRAAADGTAAGPWRAVPTVAELRPGDVIAWLKPADVKSRNTGHVLVVLENPVRNAARPDEWLVTVADSTTSPHARDSRGDDADGLGTGTIGLSVEGAAEGADGAGHPVGYYWRGGVSTVLKRTEISLGQPG